MNQLVEKGLAYPCFCSDDEITAMKEEAERRGLPPIYRFLPLSSPLEAVPFLCRRGYLVQHTRYTGRLLAASLTLLFIDAHVHVAQSGRSNGTWQRVEASKGG